MQTNIATIINSSWAPAGETETITVHAKIDDSDTFRVIIQLDPTGDTFKVKYRATDEAKRSAIDDLYHVLTLIRDNMKDGDEAPIWDALRRIGGTID